MENSNSRISNIPSNKTTPVLPIRATNTRRSIKWKKQKQNTNSLTHDNNSTSF